MTYFAIKSDSTRSGYKSDEGRIVLYRSEADARTFESPRRPLTVVPYTGVIAAHGKHLLMTDPANLIGEVI